LSHTPGDLHCPPLLAVVVPRDSSWFSFYDGTSIVPLQQQPIYKVGASAPPRVERGQVHGRPPGLRGGGVEGRCLPRNRGGGGACLAGRKPAVRALNG
jgi:hypothetical protein